MTFVVRRAWVSSEQEHENLARPRTSLSAMSDKEAKRILLQTQALQVSVLSGVGFEGVALWGLFAMTANLAHDDVNRSELRA